MRRRMLGLTVLTCLSFATAAPLTFDQAFSLDAIGNTVSALRAYRQLAQQGDVQAQRALALWAPDRKEQIEWSRKLVAARPDDADALYTLSLALWEPGSTEATPEVKVWQTKAFNVAFKKALQGDANSQDDVAFYYRDGIGADRNTDEAQKWKARAAASFQSLAEKGNLDAMTWLAATDYPGRNDQVALEWKKKAIALHTRQAQLGRIPDMLWLGDQYYSDVDTARAEAIKWLTKAAQAGNVEAMLKLVEVYESEKMDQDEEVSKKLDETIFNWNERAAQKGSAYAQFNLGKMYYEGLGITQDFAQAATWFRKALKEENQDAAYRLGWMSYLGEGVPVDHVEALKLFTWAAEKGLGAAAFQAALMTAAGEGTTPDRVKARKWLDQAGSTTRVAALLLTDDVVDHDYAAALKKLMANSTSPDAQYYLGVMYHEGFGVPQISSKAVEWWLKAADGTLPYPSALFTLANAYAAGDGVDRNYSTAASYWGEVVQPSDGGVAEVLYGDCGCRPEAQFQLGKLYLQGLGVKKDPVEAKKLLQSAADGGNTDALELLKQFY